MPRADSTIPGDWFRQGDLDLQASKPRFIIQVQGDDKPWLSGPGTVREFPELQALLDDDYKPDFEGDGFTIYKWDYPNGGMLTSEGDIAPSYESAVEMRSGDRPYEPAYVRQTCIPRHYRPLSGAR